ncbi:MAG TPA: DNA polymerase III subunit chi [Thermopetrobacter sp.]|nr:DNA polymerase III subunit chi [Thermopetrobacter sp.]
MDEDVTDVLFYQLQARPLEEVLPALLAKTLERGWRAVVRVGDAMRIPPLSDAIWSWRDEAFIPHGTERDGHAEHQPIWLSTEAAAVNGAEVLFCVAGAMPDAEELSGWKRVAVMFAGRDAARLEQARALWRSLKERDDLALTYWRQDERGRWVQQG